VKLQRVTNEGEKGTGEKMKKNGNEKGRRHGEVISQEVSAPVLPFLISGCAILRMCPLQLQ
jgi:hypothetical protein